MTNINIQEQVLSNSILKTVLEQIKDPKEKEKTLKLIEGMLSEIQGKVNGFATAIQEMSKKEEKE